METSIYSERQSWLSSFIKSFSLEWYNDNHLSWSVTHSRMQENPWTMSNESIGFNNETVVILTSNNSTQNPKETKRKNLIINCFHHIISYIGTPTWEALYWTCSIYELVQWPMEIKYFCYTLNHVIVSQVSAMVYTVHCTRLTKKEETINKAKKNKIEMGERGRGGGGLSFYTYIFYRLAEMNEEDSCCFKLSATWATTPAPALCSHSFFT